MVAKVDDFRHSSRQMYAEHLIPPHHRQVMYMYEWIDRTVAEAHTGHRVQYEYHWKPWDRHTTSDTSALGLHEQRPFPMNAVL